MNAAMMGVSFHQTSLDLCPPPILGLVVMLRNTYRSSQVKAIVLILVIAP
jgi:hypothetical protein